MSDEREPADVEELLDEAEAALADGDPEAALDLCREVHARAPNHPGAWFVIGDAQRALGDLAEAARAYRAAALGRPDHASSWASYALAAFEQLDAEEALRACFRAIKEDPENPEGWWVLSLIREWSGDQGGARRAALHARALDPGGYPLPAALSDDEVEGIINECIEALHPTVQAYLQNVAIILEDTPDEDTLRQHDPPASPLELLGTFSGPSLMERSGDDPWSNLPPTIVLFRRNLERAGGSREEVVEQLRITVFHEVGHFLGLDEDDLADRGLD
jgi:predicted Zn-dependent protease with MMP-like domain